MLLSNPLEHALPGRENAKDWLTMKIVECLAEPMDERTAEKLSNYNNAYNAVCQWSENSYSSASKQSGSSSDISEKIAKEWANKMQNEDGTQGPHWTIEQAKQVMSQRKLNYDPWTFWIAMNMIYSDYSKVAKKYNVGSSIDFYVDMTKAFLDDKDSVQNKLLMYYEHVVK